MSVEFSRVEVQRMIYTLARSELTQHVSTEEVRRLLEERLGEHDRDEQADGIDVLAEDVEQITEECDR